MVVQEFLGRNSSRIHRRVDTVGGNTEARRAFVKRKKAARKRSEEPKKDSRWGFRGMTVRDWLQLALVPIVLTLITVVFTWQQNARQQAIEDQRAASERKIEEQRGQDAALQAYLDQMSNLLLKNGLRTSAEDSEVRLLARARTLTALERLDSDRQMNLLIFLYEAHLIEKGDSVYLNVPGTIVDLQGADLRGLDMNGVGFFLWSNFSGTDLSRADLSYALLSESDFSFTTLDEANLTNVEFEGTNLSYSRAPNADLSGANLRKADLSPANYKNATLRGANLKGANLKSAFFKGADLSEANLDNANMEGAYLKDADLSGATLTQEQLASCESLEGATMPNGQKYEDWLKS
jgi:uncharacterized protein YjbI with pentapeptide repeats